ncbi:MAG: TetR/AcrR family transcriptional regulator [Dehalococcoidia bacterium]|nr:TetR/AcrR family transcriptional regulator [Dehalococcoidia bacterium]
MTIPSTGERADAAANRERIIAAARDVCRQRGPHAEMKEIAATAGVGVGTLYRHFANRHELLHAIIARTGDELTTRMRAATAAEDPCAGLREVIDVAVGTHARLGALMELAIAAHMRATLPAQHDDVAELLPGLFERGVAGGAFDPQLDPDVAIGVLRSVVVSGQIAQLAASRGYPATADALFRFVLRACGAPASYPRDRGPITTTN